MIELTTKQLMEKISNVFWNTLYPGDENLVEMCDLDFSSIKAGEAGYVFEYFRGKKWQEIIDLSDFVKKYQGPLGGGMSFMVPVAFRYYLPSFMLMVLRTKEKTESGDRHAKRFVDELLSSLVFHLTVPEKENLRCLFNEAFDPLASEQKQTVSEFLLLVKTKYDSSAEIALEEYWAQFLNQFPDHQSISKKANSRILRGARCRDKIKFIESL